VYLTVSLTKPGYIDMFAAGVRNAHILKSHIELLFLAPLCNSITCQLIVLESF